MMSCQVVTIAMSSGACAEEVAQQVAAELRFRYVNEEIISEAANRAGVTPEDVERVEHSTPLVQRVLDALARAAVASDAESEAAAAMILAPSPGWEDFTSTLAAPAMTERYRGLIRDVIWETAISGRVVIAAHAAGIYLTGMEALLRIFVTGSVETRARRLAADEGFSIEKARARIGHTDRERQAYLRRFYDIRQEKPAHYDLVVNTDVLSPAAAARAIAGAAEAMGKEVTGAGYRA